MLHEWDINEKAIETTLDKILDGDALFKAIKTRVIITIICNLFYKIA